MMNMKHTLKFSALLLLIPAMVYGQMQSYAYKRTIDSVTHKGWYALPLDADILARTEIDLRDIRIFELSNSDTVETPFLIEPLTAKSETVEIPFTPVNKSYDANTFYVTLSQDGKKTVNTIRLDFAEENFDWTVKLEGSFDQKQWQIVKENVRITRINNAYVNYSYTDLHFEPANFDFFRVSVNAGPQSKRLRFLSAVVSDIKDEPGRYGEIAVKEQSVKEKKKEKRTDVNILLDGRQRITRVFFDVVHEKDFYRTFRLYYLIDEITTPKGEHENWGLLTSGVLSSLEKPEYSFEPVKTKKLKLEVMNQNDRPLTFKTAAVSTALSQLVAELSPDNDYALVYGKSTDAAPQYDLVHFKERIPAEKRSAKLSREMSIYQPTERKAEPWFLNTWWIWGAMIVVMLLLGYVSWKMIKGAGKA